MKLVLLDRDGVLNEDRPDSVKNPDELVLLPGVGDSIRKLNDRNIKVAVVTNQSILGKKIITEQELEKIHDKLRFMIGKHGASLDQIIFCGDHPDHPTHRRKPAAGMLIEAMIHFHSEPHQTIMVGDSITDLKAAVKAKCHRMLVLTGKGQKTLDEGFPSYIKPVNICNSLTVAVEEIIGGNLKNR